MTGEKQATKWAFMPKLEVLKNNKETKEIQACGYVDKSSTYPPDPQGSTTPVICELLEKEKVEIKQQKINQMDLSFKKAA